MISLGLVVGSMAVWYSLVVPLITAGTYFPTKTETALLICLAGCALFMQYSVYDKRKKERLKRE